MIRVGQSTLMNFVDCGIIYSNGKVSLIDMMLIGQEVLKRANYIKLFQTWDIEYLLILFN